MDRSIERRTLLKAGAASLAVCCGTGLATQAWADDVPSAAGADIETIIAGMPRRQKIEQMLMPDFRQWNDEEGAAHDLTVMNDDVRAIIDKYHFGGIILFLNNVAETEQSLKLTCDMQAAALTNSANDPYGDIPLLLGIDQEGGIVYRLSSGCNMPGNMAVGATNSEEDATAYGDVVGSELAALKFNVNFAPVFDVNSNPNNPVIGLRSISSDPDLVAKLGLPIMHALQDHNLATCAKHFPGHGDAGTDSHTGLPRIDKSLEELEACEFIPFRAAFDDGCDMVMTAHIQYPNIEKGTAISTGDGTEINLPATLSKTFMTDILRDSMGFKGVASTDALNMDAIAKNFDYIDAVKRAFVAGVDIALMPVTMRSTADTKALDDLLDALEQDTDELPDERLDQSVRRILTLKKNRGILSYHADEGSYSEWLATAKATVGSDSNRATEREISADAVCVVRNENDTLPFRLNDGDHLLLVGAYSNEMPGMEFAMKRLQSEGKIPQNVTWESDNYVEAYDYTAGKAVEGISPKLEHATHLVVISEISSVSRLQTEKADIYSGYVPAALVKRANELGIPACVMSISQPYDTAIYDMAPAVCAVFGYVGMDPTEGLRPDAAFGPNIPAGIEVICGAHAAQGTMPVDVPTVIAPSDGGPAYDLGNIKYPLGFGIAYAAISDEGNVDKSALAALIADINDNVIPKKSSYTAASFEALEKALATAQAVLDNEDVTQDQVDGAVSELTAARKALVAVSGNGGGAGGSDDGTGSSNTGANGHKPDNGAGSKPSPGPLPQTGDVAGIAAAAVAAAGGLSAAAGWRTLAHNASDDDDADGDRLA